MNTDIGIQGLALLIGPALVFGLLAQALLWRHTTHWLWLIASLAWIVGGFVASEVIYGAEVTEENLQPLIDGLLFDEALLGGLVAGVGAVLVTWLLLHTGGHRSLTAS